MKFDVVVKLLKLKTLKQLLSEIYQSRGGKTTVLLTLLEIFFKKTVCICSDIYEQVWFKLGMRIDTAQLYVFL